MAIARYTLAVDRRFNRNGDQSADFIGCVAFGRSAEFAEKYLKQGTKIAITGRIQTGSYTNKDGNKLRSRSLLRARLQADRHQAVDISQQEDRHLAMQELRAS